MTDPQSDRRRQAYAVAARIGLTRQERLELAEFLLKKDCTSWKQLSDAQIQRICDALEGFALVNYLLDQRNPAQP